MGLISQNEKLASSMQLEDIACPFRNDDLPALAHAHDSEDMEPARSHGVARLPFIMVHERIEARATPIFWASSSWVIPWRVLSESMF